jgi:hypothetical protein
VDVDIEGDYLIPVVWNGRLYLFWPIFTEEAESQSIIMPKADHALEEPPRYWKIQMAWSEYKNNKRLPKKLSTENVKVTSTSITEHSPFLFFPLPKNQDFPVISISLLDGFPSTISKLISLGHKVFSLTVAKASWRSRVILNTLRSRRHTY